MRPLIAKLLVAACEWDWSLSNRKLGLVHQISASSVARIRVACGGQKSKGNLKSGRWVGAKSKDRTPTPRTKATQLLRAWIIAKIAIGSKFNWDRVPSAIGMEAKKLNSAKTVLRRQGMIALVDQFGNQTTWRRLK